MFNDEIIAPFFSQFFAKIDRGKKKKCPKGTISVQPAYEHVDGHKTDGGKNGKA